MKRGLKIVAIVVVVLIVIVIALPFLIDANTFRPKLETELTEALGRQVKVGNLSLSLLSGGVAADNIAIADDPEFSKTDFVEAQSLKVGVELIPLIFSKSLNVTEITLNGPQINLVKSENGDKWNFSSLGAPGGAAATESKPPEQPKTPAEPAPSSASTPNLTIAKLNVKDGSLTISQVGSNQKYVYDKVNISLTHFSFASSFPFTLTAELPGGGSLKLQGNAGPVANNAAFTPLQATISIQQMNLAQSGFLDPASGIAGVADFDGNVASDGHDAKTSGTLKAAKLQVVQKGSPAGRPVQLTYAVNYDLKKQDGTITQGDLAMGKAVAHLTGNYDAHGKVTAVNLKLNGQGMPVDELEAMLPALGVVLPPKATLKGGDLNVNLTTEGPVNKLVTTGTVQMQNTSLANFDLGSKLSAVSAFGGKQTGNDTTIQNFSSEVRVAPEGTQANNINLTLPAIGVLTGDGTVSPANALAFKMKATVGGVGIPFAVEGTTSDPKFVPDVKGLAGGLLQNALKGQTGQQSPLSGITGLFKKKQH